MKSNFNLLFYIRKQKNYKGGAMPIYMRITVNGKRADLSAGRECELAKWNSQAGRANGTKEETKSLNNYLDCLQSKIRDAHKLLIDSNQQVTNNQFTGKTQKSRYIMQLFTEHNTQIKELIGNVILLFLKFADRFYPSCFVMHRLKICVPKAVRSST